MTTSRATTALTISAFALAATLGMTASIWNPITRAYDRLEQGMTSQVVNDAATPDPLPMTPYWVPVSQELGDALAEGEYEGIADAWTYDWERCLVHIDDTTIITCPGGIRIES